MNSHINLVLRSSNNKSVIGSKKVKTFRLVAVVLLFVVAGLSVLLFIMIASSPLNTLRKQEQEAEAKLGIVRAQFAKQLLTKNQVATIATVLKTRSDLVKTYDILQKTLSPELTITDLSMSTTAITLTIRASSLVSLEQFLSLVKQKAEGKELFATVVVSAISFNASDGTYALQVSIK